MGYLVAEPPWSANDIAIAAWSSLSSEKLEADSEPNDIPPGNGREGAPLSPGSKFAKDEEAAPILTRSLDPPAVSSFINLGATVCTAGISRNIWSAVQSGKVPHTR